jgi:hypothetical protein
MTHEHVESGNYAQVRPVLDPPGRVATDKEAETRCAQAMERLTIVAGAADEEWNNGMLQRDEGIVEANGTRKKR